MTFDKWPIKYTNTTHHIQLYIMFT